MCYRSDHVREVERERGRGRGGREYETHTSQSVSRFFCFCKGTSWYLYKKYLRRYLSRPARLWQASPVSTQLWKVPNRLSLTHSCSCTRDVLGTKGVYSLHSECVMPLHERDIRMDVSHSGTVPIEE